MLKVYLIIFIFSFIISYLWVRGIDKMKEEHPDYNGKDLFQEEIEENQEK